MQTDMSPDVESEPSQSFSSVGVDDSQENLEFDSTADIFTSTGKEVAGATMVAPSEAIQKEEPVDDDVEEVATPVRELVQVDSTEDSKEIVAEAIADTTMDDSDFLESSAAMRKSIHDRMDISNMIEHGHGPTRSVEVLRGASAPVQADSQEGAPAMPSMREKLQSLIGELATAVLTRDEVNVFEDMFMDAKEKLYGAARRGRAESS